MFWEASAPLTAQSSSSSALAPLRPWWTRARGCTVRETPDLASTEVAVLDGCQMVMVERRRHCPTTVIGLRNSVMNFESG